MYNRPLSICADNEKPGSYRSSDDTPPQPNRLTAMNNTSGVGQHLIIDFIGAKYQTDVDQIEHALTSAAEASNALVLHTNIHQFPDSNGVTGVVLLAESHISIHSWPEHDYMALDIFMCGATDPQLALAWLTNFFEPVSVKTQVIDRGKGLLKKNSR